MAELFGVGGAICEKPETCHRCKVGFPIGFQSVVCADPTNNHILGWCESCAKKEEIAREYSRLLSDEQHFEIDRLEANRYYAFEASRDSLLIEIYGKAYLSRQVEAADKALSEYWKTLPPYPSEIKE